MIYTNLAPTFRASAIRSRSTIDSSSDLPPLPFHSMIVTNFNVLDDRHEFYRPRYRVKKKKETNDRVDS